MIFLLKSLRHFALATTIWMALPGATAQTIKLQTAPFGSSGGPTGNTARESRWRQPVPGKTVKLAEKIQFLAALSDHSKILFSGDKKTYQLLDLASGEITAAFQQSEGASWTAADGNTVVTRLGFGERYLLRSAPNFEAEGPWNPPAGTKASGFAFGTRCRDFLCLTSNGAVRQVSLGNLQDTEKPVVLDDYWDGETARPSFRAVRSGLHILSASPDLRRVLMGNHIYRKDENGKEKVSHLSEETRTIHQGYMAGSGDWVSPFSNLSLPASSPPGSNLLVGRDARESSRLTFFDAAKSRPLFSILTTSSDHLEPTEGVETVIYCESLDKLIIAHPDSGAIDVFDLKVKALSNIYPVQLSKREVAVKSLASFSYLPVFSRKEFIDRFDSNPALGISFEFDHGSGRITAKEVSDGRKPQNLILTFRAFLKGGDSVTGSVLVYIEE